MLQLLHARERAVHWGMLNSAIQAVSVLIGSVLVVTIFPGDVQGVHYTFISIAAAQVLIELGFAQAIVPVIAHERANLVIDSGQIVSGAVENVARVRDIIRLTAIWYFAAALVAAAGLSSGGCLYFASTPDIEGLSWKEGWLLLSVGVGFSIITAPLLYVEEALGEAAWANRARLIASIIRLLIFTVAVLGGAELKSAGLSVLAQAATIAVQALPRWLPRIRKILSITGTSTFSWRREMFPLQARLAVSWASGYILFSAFNPVLLRFAGPYATGRFGLTWTLLQGISTISMIWVSTKGPTFAVFWSKKEKGELLKIWRSAERMALLSACSGCVALLGGGAILAASGHRFSERLLPLGEIALLAGGLLLNIKVFAMAALLRANKREPYMIQSVMGAACTGVLLVMLCQRYAALGAVLAYFITSVVFYPLGRRIFRKELAAAGMTGI